MDAAFSTHADPALVDLFRAESDTHLPVLSQGLLALERGQADDTMIASMMRAAHSIKGAARIVGIDAAVRVAHALEDCFTAAKTDRSVLSSAAVDVLLQGVDALQRICSMQPDADMTPAWLESQVATLTAVKAGRAPVDAGTQAPRRAVDSSPAEAATPDEVTIDLPVELDEPAAGILRDRFQQALDAGAAKLRLDFAPVRGISALALALLSSLGREAGHREPIPKLEMNNLSAPLAALLRVTALDRTWTAGT